MRWFVIYSEIGHEFEAWANLAMRGFGVYMPLATRVRRKPLKTSKAPLLSRYLFVCCPAAKIHETKAARGVEDVLGHELIPQPVPESEIERLQRCEASGEFVFGDTATAKKRERIVLRSFKELAIYQIPGQSC